MTFGLMSTMFCWAIPRGYTLFNAVSGALLAPEMVPKTMRKAIVLNSTVRAQLRDWILRTLPSHGS